MSKGPTANTVCPMCPAEHNPKTDKIANEDKASEHI